MRPQRDFRPSALQAHAAACADIRSHPPPRPDPARLSRKRPDQVRPAPEGQPPPHTLSTHTPAAYTQTRAHPGHATPNPHARPATPARTDPPPPHARTRHTRADPPAMHARTSHTHTGPVSYARTDRARFTTASATHAGALPDLRARSRRRGPADQIAKRCRARRLCGSGPSRQARTRGRKSPKKRRRHRGRTGHRSIGAG